MTGVVGWLEWFSQSVCVCLWNNTAAYEESSIAREKHQRGASHFLDVTVMVGIVCCYQSCECATDWH
jgi:hypothetical protein